MGRVVMPQGIDEIKKFLKQKDNVPLQVSIFTNSSAETIKDMIEICQQEGEVVMCIGSSSRSENLQIFQKADISVAIEVSPCIICRQCKGRMFNQGFTPSFLSNIGEKLNTLPCAFALGSQVSLFAFMSLIKNARRAMQNLQQGLIFNICIQISTLICIACCYCANSESLTHLEVFFLQMIIYPLFSLSIMNTPAQPELRDNYPTKIGDFSLKDHKRFILGCITRIFCLVFGNTTTIILQEQYFMRVLNYPKQDLFYFVMFLQNTVILSAGFLFQYHSKKKIKPFLNKT